MRRHTSSTSGTLTDREGNRHTAILTFFAESRCTIVVGSIYAPLEQEARQRIPGDPDDWHTVALAMATKTAIWPLDQKHFFRCGMAVWNTRVLAPYSRILTKPDNVLTLG